jgi:hypothetical protein
VVGVTGEAKFLYQNTGSDAGRGGQRGQEAGEVRFKRCGCWRRNRYTDLESAPSGAIEQLGVIGGGNDHRARRQIVHLHKERRYNPLDLTSLMGVSAFFADSIELIEKEHTRNGPSVFEDMPEPCGGFAEITRDDRIVSDDQKWQRQGLGETFGKRGLAIARRANQEYPMPG